jgi:type IV/VI secretion system ImpK/VasF family protein
MTPTFQAATIPVMLDILALSERAAAGTSGPVEVERAALRATFETAAAVCRGPLATEWELASYALAAAADELLIVDITWPGQSWWENHALEVELFGSRRRATEFYARAERASALPTGNALLVFVAAVVMGFRGTYRDRPEALDAWLRTQTQRVQLSIDRPRLPSSGPEVGGAPPLSGRSTLLWAGLSAAVAMALLIVAVWAVFFVL